MLVSMEFSELLEVFWDFKENLCPELGESSESSKKNSNFQSWTNVRHRFAAVW